MKRIGVLLGILSIAVSNGALCGHNDTDRTFLNMQQVQDRPLISAFAENLRDQRCQSSHDDTKSTMKMDVTITPFFNQTFDSKNIGRYFGSANSNVITAKDIATVRTESVAQFALASIFRDLTNGFRLFFTNTSQQATITLNPRQRSIGSHFGIAIKMNGDLEGLSLRLNSAVVRNTNDLKKTITEDTPRTSQPSTVSDYLAGRGFSDFQEALTAGKIDVNSHSHTGIDDINAQLRYTILDQDDRAIESYIDVLVPTGNKPTGKFLFESIVGTRSFQMGLGACGRTNLYENDDASTRTWIEGNALWRYGFAGAQDRVISPNIATWDQYYLTTNINNVANTQVFVPAANLLLQKINVTPGNIFKAEAQLCAIYKKMSGQCGYQLCYKQEENNSRTASWNDNTTYLILDTYNITLSAQTNIANGDAIVVNQVNFNINHPEQIFHSFFATLGYTGTCKNDSVAWALALGASFNTSGNGQAAPRSWDIFGKVGITF